MVDSINVCEFSFQTNSPNKVPSRMIVVGYSIKRTSKNTRFIIKCLSDVSGLTECINLGFQIESVRIKGWFKSNYIKLMQELRQVDAAARYSMEVEYDKKSNRRS